MQKMQQRWRAEEQLRNEKSLADGDDRDGAVDEDHIEDMGMDSSGREAHKPYKKRHRERGDNIWHELNARKRTEAAIGDGNAANGLVGLHDVVKAPPRFAKSRGCNEAELKVKLGGVKKQAELTEARKSVIAGYRAMMKQRREGIDI